MNARKDTKTAAETYAARRTEIARLIDVLEMHLEINDKAHAQAPGNWGLVGNLEKVKSDLVNLVGFMSNMDPEHVEDFLNNAE
ncbi:MAG: hypothetical protein U0638_14150 [Phycisphaerales bacterium]